MLMSLRYRCPVRAPRPASGGAGNEEGIAMVVALLVLMLSSILVVGVLALATHTQERSGLTRDRTAALNAAEAGIQSELSVLSNGGCPPSVAGAAVALPNQTQPSASYVIQPSPSCTSGSATATIVATGYVPNTTNPISTTTMVAHITRNQGAPVSAGASGGYDFPDALFADGAVSAPGTLNLYGTGGSVPNITADTITVGNSGSQLGGALTGEPKLGESPSTGGIISVAAAQIGGAVTGTNVTLTGPSTGMAVQGAVDATGNLSLNNVSINNASGSYGGTYTHTGTISGTVTQSAATLGLSRPLGTFTNNASDIATQLGVGTATASCPGTSSWSSSFFDTTSSCPATAPTTYSPTAGNGTTVIIVQGTFNLTVPTTPVGGQLYVIDAGGGSSNDNLTITGNGSTLPVFAYTDGSLNLSGTVAGQFAGHTITAPGSTATTTVTFTPPATPMPDVAFPAGYTPPTLNGTNAYVSSVSYEYQCPGTTAC
jgi:Tfp pilus assembly protein PilX